MGGIGERRNIKITDKKKEINNKKTPANQDLSPLR